MDGTKKISEHHWTGWTTADLIALAEGVRFQIRRKGCHQPESMVRGVIERVKTALESGQIRDKDEVPGFTRSLLNAAAVTEGWRAESKADAGLAAEIRGRLKQLDAAAVEALVSYYVSGESAESICRKFGMADSDFALLRKKVTHP